MRLDVIKKQSLTALKIAVGSTISIILAERLGLTYATSAGTITLLTVLTSRMATLKLAGIRILSFFVTTILGWLSFTYITGEWWSYGLFMLTLLLISYCAGWKDAISVNAVIGTHFWTSQDFSMKMITNEFMLVILGITVAIIVNMYHNNQGKKNQLIQDMRSIEVQLQEILTKLSAFLRQEIIEGNVWDDIYDLDEHLAHSIERAYDYHENTFVSHPEYYIHYIEMRTKQCDVLHNLHYQINRIRTMPEQAHIIADYVDDVRPHVNELNIPEAQLEELHHLTEAIQNGELPKTREEFEGRAILYHILMDLEEFLIFKKRFIEHVTEQQKLIYWGEYSGEESEK